MALETKTIIKVDTGSATVSLKSLRDEIKAAKEVMLTAEEGSIEYSKALQIAADKAFALREMQVKIRGTAADLGEMLANGTKVLGGVASGYAAVQGAMNLFGIQNKTLESSLVKVQSAIALMNGLQGLEGLGKNLSNLMIQLKATEIGQKAFAAATWLVNAAMNANPIGLFIGLFVALGAAVYALTDIFNDQAAAIEKENTALDGLVFTSKEAAEAHNQQLIVLKELDQQWDVSTGKITVYEKSLIDLAESYEEQMRKISSETEEKLESVNGFWNNTWRIIKQGFSGSGESFIATKTKELTKIYIEENNKIFAANKEKFDKEALLKLEESKRQTELSKERSEAYKKEIQEINDRIRQNAIDRAKVWIDQAKAVKENNEKEALASRQFEIAQLNKKIEHFRKDSKNLSDVTLDIRKTIEDKYQKDVAAVNKKYDDMAKAAAKDKADFIINEEKRALIEIAEIDANAATQKMNDDIAASEFAATLDENQKARRQKDLDDAATVAEAKANIQWAEVELVQTTSDILKLVFEKNRGIQKAGLIVDKTIAIAQVWINNAAANAKAIATFPTTLGQPFVTLNTVQAGLQSALIVAQTAKALQALGGGDSGGGGGSSQTSISVSKNAPSIPQSILPTRNTLTPGEYNLQNQPIKAYVVETELTKTQKKVAATKSEASF